MTEAKEKPLEMFNLPATLLATIKAHDGSQRARIPFGHVRLKVRAISSRMKEGQTQYQQAIVDSEVVRHDGHPEAVGMTTRSYYTADGNAKPYVLQRTKAFLDAVGAVYTPNGVNTKELIGREYEATIVWETSTQQDATDPMNTKTRTYVNDRVIGERKVGTPTEIDPKVMSRDAIAHLDKEGTGGSAGGSQPWEKGTSAPQAATPAQAAEPEASESGEATEGSGGDEGEWTEDAYRALIVMNHPAAGQARQALEGNGIAVDGPIDENKLPAELKVQYLAFKAKNNGGLPALALGKKGKKNAAQTSA